MKEPFDYSLIPYRFGMCAAEECPHAATCLRQIALNHVSAEHAFLSILNPHRIKAMKGACDFYRSDEKVRYAKGFMRTINALNVRKADTFRYRMIEFWGRKVYYMKRKGEKMLTLSEQQRVVMVAKEMGVVQDEYFDGYVEDYNWE